MRMQSPASFFSGIPHNEAGPNAGESMNKKNQILFLYLVMSLIPLSAAANTPIPPAGGIQVIKSLEFKGLDGPVRLQNGLVVFSHYEESSGAHNAVLLNPGDGGFQKVVADIPGARFIAEDSRYLVYSSRGNAATPLTLQDKHSGKPVASTNLNKSIQWGHIAGDRLIVVQSGGSHMQNARATALIYSLPALKLEKTVEITGGNETVLWGDKILSIGFSLGIYDLNLRTIALVDMPAPDPGGRGGCGGGPLRIIGDKAVVGANCGQLVVVDLPAARVERIIRADSAVQSFDVANGLIFTVSPADKQREVRVLELASGLELARLPIDADFVAVQGNHLLGMKKGERFGAPVQFTLYEVDLESITSETARIARIKAACGAAEHSLTQGGDLYTAIEACENSGIRSFVNGPRIAPELVNLIGNYAVWLTRTLTRYNEGIALLERVGSEQPSERFAVELAAGKRKAGYLDPAGKTAAAGAAPAGVTSVAVNFGGFSDLISFAGEHVYIPRWLCAGKPSGYPDGVALDVLERGTFRAVKRITVADCDHAQQDYISTMIHMPGYVVLGITYKFPQPGRPTVVVIDEKSLAVTAKGTLNDDVARLRQWKGKLLACVAPGEASLRFDPQTARLVPAARDEVEACTRGNTLALGEQAVSMNLEMPVAETKRFRVQRLPAAPESMYRITRLKDGQTSPGMRSRPYLDILPVREQDALVLGFPNGAFRRFVLFDLATQSESVLFELNPAGRIVAATVWDKFLFVALGHDLLVYDLKGRMVVKYDQGLIAETGVRRLLVDQNRLLLGTDGESARVIDLSAYLVRLPKTDFFAQ